MEKRKRERETRSGTETAEVAAAAAAAAAAAGRRRRRRWRKNRLVKEEQHRNKKNATKVESLSLLLTNLVVKKITKLRGGRSLRVRLFFCFWSLVPWLFWRRKENGNFPK